MTDQAKPERKRSAPRSMDEKLTELRDQKRAAVVKLRERAAKADSAHRELVGQLAMAERELERLEALLHEPDAEAESAVKEPLAAQ